MNEATILTLVAQGMGVGFVVETARWRLPAGVAILNVVDLKLSLPLALVWRKDNLSPLLSRFVADVTSLVQREPAMRAAPWPNKSREPSRTTSKVRLRTGRPGG